MLNEAHNVVLILWILIHEEAEELALLHGEFVINLGVAVDFDRDLFAA